nr:integrase, catalytic region, zinc finger, CCHC-type, peptidase aspartic, catalytic [Tanacetum cinerariifolium]
MTGDRSRLLNFMKKFIGTVRFGNDHFGAIMGYGDYVVGENVISRVYHVEGLGHNLFSVGQFCDSDLEVAFRKHSCYVRDTDGVHLIKGSRGSNLYTISVEDMMKSSLICLLSKAFKNKSWLWHRRLNHLNFGTINDLARKDLVRGLPRLKFEKDHLCSACGGGGFGGVAGSSGGGAQWRGSGSEGGYGVGGEGDKVAATGVVVVTRVAVAVTAAAGGAWERVT